MSRPLVLASLFVVGCSRGGSTTRENAPALNGSATGSASEPTGDRVFATPTDAFRAVLERRPLVLAVGEAHAQKAAPGAVSSAKRFTETMLPELAGKASDLILELMVPPSGCEERTKAVNKEMREVTAPQAPTNQNEYVALGDAAQKLGVEPHLLHPTCDDFKAITARHVDAADATDASLRVIARLLRDTTERALARNASRASTSGGAEKMVVVYGGAMHNDVEPLPGMEDYAYGKALATLTKGRYVELDVFVPELVRDGGLWTKLPFYARFERKVDPDKTKLFVSGERGSMPASFTIVLPVSPVTPP